VQALATAETFEPVNGSGGFYQNHGQFARGQVGFSIYLLKSLHICEGFPMGFVFIGIYTSFQLATPG